MNQFAWNYQSLQLPTYHLPTSIKITFSGAPTPASAAKSIEELTAGTEQIHRLRDGELILYRRSDSRIWQYKFKRESGSWYRASTRKSVLEQAKRVAMDLHDEARYRERLGLAPAHKSFKDIAMAAVEDMQRDLAAGTGKKIYVDYCSVIERYFIPYFGDKYLQNLKHKDIADFEAWRNHRMARTPKSSTLMTFASAFSRVHQTAISRGWISDRVPIPTMSRRGAKGEVRPAFSVEEIAQLRQFMTSWQKQGYLDYDRIMRPLLCAYVEFLLLTGMRHGTESMGIEWRHCEWYASEGQRYIRVWVDGKTGGRWLIAKHEAQAVLITLHSLQPDIADKPIEQVMGRDTKYLFRRPDGQRPRTFNGMFSKLMRESGLRWNHSNQSRTLYSLRHSYATMELLAETDIHTLARQMGTSVRMLEQHYSKLTATMAADKLA